MFIDLAHSAIDIVLKKENFTDTNMVEDQDEERGGRYYLMVSDDADVKEICDDIMATINEFDHCYIDDAESDAMQPLWFRIHEKLHSYVFRGVMRGTPIVDISNHYGELQITIYNADRPVLATRRFPN